MKGFKRHLTKRATSKRVGGESRSIPFKQDRGTPIQEYRGTYEALNSTGAANRKNNSKIGRVTHTNTFGQHNFSSGAGVQDSVDKRQTSSLSLHDKEGQVIDKQNARKHPMKLEKQSKSDISGKKLKHARTFIINKNDLTVDQEKTPLYFNHLRESCVVGDKTNPKIDDAEIEFQDRSKKTQSNKAVKSKALMSPGRVNPTKAQLLRRATQVGQNIIQFHETGRRQNNSSFSNAAQNVLTMRATPTQVQSPKNPNDLYVGDG